MKKQKFNKEFNSKYIFALISGLLFLIFGILQFIVGIGFLSFLGSALFIPQDILGGFILVLIGIIYLTSVYELRQGITEGVAYIYVAIILSLFFMGIYLLIMLTNGLEAGIFTNEDLRNWTPINDIRPGIYLSIISLFGFIIWREKFSFKNKTSHE
jgi:hypothetical protein